MAEEKNKEALETENKVEETNKSEEVNSDNIERIRELAKTKF